MSELGPASPPRTHKAYTPKGKGRGCFLVKRCAAAWVLYVAPLLLLLSVPLSYPNTSYSTSGPQPPSNAPISLLLFYSYLPFSLTAVFSMPTKSSACNLFERPRLTGSREYINYLRQHFGLAIPHEVVAKRLLEKEER